MPTRPTRGLDYSVQLSDIDAPAKSRAGELLIEAGKSEGQAAAIQGATIAKGVEFLGTTGLAAVKGKMEADLERDVNDSLAKLEGVGTQAVQSEAALDNLRSQGFANNVAEQLVALREQSGMEEPQLMKDFMGDITRYADAQKQGILSRGDVVARIGASVKKYSAMMPGWAGDFRKVAANLTGISNVDVYGIHTALTTKSAREKAQEKAVELDLTLRKEIASEMGLSSLDQVTPQMMAYHYQSRQLKVASENAKRKLEMSNLGQEEADKAWHNVATLQLSSAVADIGKDIAKLGALHQDTTKAMEAQEFGLQLSGKLAMTLTTLERDVMEMTRPQPGRTALSAKQATTIIESYRGIFKNYEEAVKNVEGRNMFAALVKNAQGKVDLLVNNFLTSNPHIAILNKTGSVSEIFKAYVAIGSPEEFEKRFGKALRNAMDSVMKAPEGHANLIGAAHAGQNVDLSQVSQVSPQLATVVAADFIQSIKEWSKDPNPTEQKKATYSNVFANASRSLNPVVKRDIETAYSILSSPDTQTFLGTLSPAQRANALLPLLANIDASYKNVKAQIDAEIQTANTSGRDAREGALARLEPNRLTGAFELVVAPREDLRSTPLDKFADSPSGAAMAGPGYTGLVNPDRRAGGLAGQFTDQTRTAALDRARDLTGRFNRMLETFTLAARGLGTEQVPTINDARARAAAGESLMGVSVPKNTEQGASFDQNKVLTAIQTAEGTIGGKNMGPSSAGALGPFQFMPATAKQYGLAIDPETGKDERLDAAKAGAAALKYMTNLAKMWNGNLELMAASYNAGEGNVQKAVDKAKKLGVPDQWRAFLPKPEETVPYIQRFVGAYGQR